MRPVYQLPPGLPSSHSIHLNGPDTSNLGPPSPLTRVFRRPHTPLQSSPSASQPSSYMLHIANHQIYHLSWHTLRQHIPMHSLLPVCRPHLYHPLVCWMRKCTSLNPFGVLCHHLLLIPVLWLVWGQTHHLQICGKASGSKSPAEVAHTEFIFTLFTPLMAMILTISWRG